MLVAVDFIEHSVVNQLTEDSLITTSHAITLKEEGVTLRLLHNVVKDYTYFIAEALVVQLVSLFEDNLENSLERRNNLRVSC